MVRTCAQNSFGCRIKRESAFKVTPHELRQRNPYRIADGLQLDQVQALLTVLVLRNIRLRLTNAFGDLTLSEIGLDANLSQEGCEAVLLHRRHHIFRYRIFKVRIWVLKVEDDYNA
jgi:hypothetical protein